MRLFFFEVLIASQVLIRIALSRTIPLSKQIEEHFDEEIKLHSLLRESPTEPSFDRLEHCSSIRRMSADAVMQDSTGNQPISTVPNLIDPTLNDAPAPPPAPATPQLPQVQFPLTRALEQPAVYIFALFNPMKYTRQQLYQYKEQLSIVIGAQSSLPVVPGLTQESIDKVTIRVIYTTGGPSGLQLARPVLAEGGILEIVRDDAQLRQRVANWSTTVVNWRAHRDPESKRKADSESTTLSVVYGVGFNGWVVAAGKTFVNVDFVPRPSEANELAPKRAKKVCQSLRPRRIDADQVDEHRRQRRNRHLRILSPQRRSFPPRHRLPPPPLAPLPSISPHSAQSCDLSSSTNSGRRCGKICKSCAESFARRCMTSSVKS